MEKVKRTEGKMDTHQKKILGEIRNIFAAHLESKGLRKTPERFAIVEEIYSRNDHFDAESLYTHMLSRNYRVSRATVYNTLELLLSCDLITKHQFGKNLAQYEKSVRLQTARPYYLRRLQKSCGIL